MTFRPFLSWPFAIAATNCVAIFLCGCASPTVHSDATTIAQHFFIEEEDFTPDYVAECKMEAENNNSEAQALYGMALLKGWGVKKDSKSAFSLIRKSADAKNPVGQMLLGDCLRNGIGVDKDAPQAIGFYDKAARQGHPRAQSQLGYCYMKGVGVNAEVTKSREWYKTAMNTYLKEAKKGNARAQLQLGAFYGLGRGVEKNPDLAVEWFKKAAAQGYIPAYERLGDCHKFGMYDVKKDQEQANLWFGKAMDAYRIEAENGNAIAQYRLGHHYYFGNGVEKDYEKAVTWWRKSAEQGYAKAQGDFGLCYEKGYGVEKDLEKAEYWYRLAAENGDEEAQECLRQLAKKGK